ncbi:hypothetical protein G0Q07_08240 [Draconibacterium halophilum]|uniref:Transposase n=1 Tax=Draconibacterium halophilum TaxID=2706887 RepID=A0A6C0R7R8_9BACT|nr:hypothetical protein G0Q07_08240 [Draconibacterium halophilum]
MKPKKYKKQKLTSKGVHSEVVLQYFPIRRKAAMLHVRCRRWLVEATGEVVSWEWDWDWVARKALYKGFRAFFKEYLDTFSISANSLEKLCHIDGNRFGQQYIKHLSSYNNWEQKDLARVNKKGAKLSFNSLIFNGRDTRIRTWDPLLPKQVR